jgi:PAS domain S-box-containing protein
MNLIRLNIAGVKELLARRYPASVEFNFWGWCREIFLRYWLAVLAALICFLIRWSLDPILRDRIPFSLFLIAVLVTAWRGGLRPSLVATGLGLLVGFSCFLEPRQEFAVPDLAGWITVGSYLFTALLICWYTEKVRVAKGHFQEARAELETQRQKWEERITRYKRTEAALQENAERFDGVFQAIPHEVWTAQPDGACDFVSTRWEQYTGTTAEEALGYRWLQQVHPEDRGGAQTSWAKALKTRSEADFEFRLKRRDGSYRWFKSRAIPYHDASGEVIKWFGTRTEITDIVEMREALKRGRQELERLVQERTAGVERLKSKLQEENYYLREKISLSQRHYRIVGQAPALLRVLSQAEKVAPTDSTVLLLGETGTGKELLAGMVHQLSARGQRPLVSVNCAAVPAPLVESELFGREKGAFTGSLSRQVGRFELADGATIFLDEIGELPPEVQSKLLRVLEAKQVERLGNPRPVSVDVRVIAATNRDLEKAVSEGKFRKDLYYRLNVFPIRMPTLRERREDIPLLVWAFVDEFAKLFNKNIQSIEKESLDALQRYSWPGNVRELRNSIERAMIIASGTKLQMPLPAPPVLSAVPEDSRLEEVERKHIVVILERSGWRIRGVNGAAEQLGLKPTTLEARMAKLGIHRPAVTTGI